MENLKQKIKNDLNEALKNADDVSRSVLGMVLAAIMNKELAKAKEATPEEIIEILFLEAKKRKESIAAFEKGNRQDLVEKEKKELAILQKYLPEQMSEEDLRKIIKEAIEKTGAKEIKDMGKVMKELMPEVKGKAEGNTVKGVVMRLLKG